MKKQFLFSLSLLTILSLANAENMGEPIFTDKNGMQTSYAKENLRINTNKTNAIKKDIEQTKREIEELQKLQNNLVVNQQNSYEGNYNSNSYDESYYASSYNNNAKLDEQEIALMKSAIRNKDLKALQYKFFAKNYKGTENTSILAYEENKTHKIRTRSAMATTLIFEADIQSYILGDNNGFKIEELPNKNNALVIKPLLIGIDTNLIVVTKDDKLHTFYLFSTDHKSVKDPNFIVYITDKTTKQILENKKTKLEKDYIVLKEGTHIIKINKNEIQRNFVQKAKKENEWLMAEEIFADKKFTYFKYSKDKMPQIPTIYAVIDKQDSPVETRIMGDYIIAETINPKFTIKSGDSFVCVDNLHTIDREIKTPTKRLQSYTANNDEAINKVKGE